MGKLLKFYYDAEDVGHVTDGGTVSNSKDMSQQLDSTSCFWVSKQGQDLTFNVPVLH